MQIRYCDSCGAMLPQLDIPGTVNVALCEKCGAARGELAETPTRHTPAGGTPVVQDATTGRRKSSRMGAIKSPRDLDAGCRDDKRICGARHNAHTTTSGSAGAEHAHGQHGLLFLRDKKLPLVQPHLLRLTRGYLPAPASGVFWIAGSPFRYPKEARKRSISITVSAYLSVW